ncbi:TIGR03084 family metal-binding protein [Williamsia soli]|uniref:TIGR03084 family metal-binding protein n=1 Tax=Williamsia soli TaxID=364929 RepID=UPI001A9F04E0|nr:TIGR03084 family metal-binding protein [Williamsia soli]
MSIVDELVSDLSAETELVDRLVADLPESGWETPTPAAGWTVKDQIAHLSWTDEQARIAATDKVAFDDILKVAWQNPTGFVDDGAREEAAKPTGQLLDEWRQRRQALADALVATPSGEKLPWFGPPMSAASMATARLMEVWAHGLDVADALGVVNAPTGRLKSIAHLGVRTRDFAYQVNGEIPPTDAFRVELAAPDGSTWTWGPDDATQRITGSALDFCLLVTQRRNPSELDIETTGEDAAHWATIAQCFAGPPGRGR